MCYLRNSTPWEVIPGLHRSSSQPIGRGEIVDVAKAGKAAVWGWLEGSMMLGKEATRTFCLPAQGSPNSVLSQTSPCVLHQTQTNINQPQPLSGHREFLRTFVCATSSENGLAALARLLWLQSSHQRRMSSDGPWPIVNSKQQWGKKQHFNN